jgi:dolichol-phosphate mannosyltransferase
MDGRGRTPDISVVVPTLDEAENVDSLLTRLFAAFGRESLEIEVLFADGGSTDGTQEKARAWESRAPVRLVDARSGRGLTGDVLTAARQARADVVLVMDGDLSHSPEQAPELVRPVLEGSRDMVIGSRYVPGGRIPDWPWKRRAMSRIARAVVWPLTDVRDPTSGFFAIGRDKLLGVADDAEGFKIGLEVLLRNEEDLRVSEVPICFPDRSHGRSKMSLRQAACYLRRAVALTGGAATTATARRFAAVGLPGLAADVGLFLLLRSRGLDLALSHILGFALVATVGYLACSRWVFEPPAGKRRGWAAPVRFVTVCLMALFLRGGVLAMLTQRGGWPEPAALLAAALAAGIITYLGSAFFAFRRDDGRSDALSWRLAALGLIGYSVLLRLVYLSLPDLLPEEAYYWNYAQHPALGYLDHPPMVAWLIGLGAALFGDTELGVRIGAFLCWFVTAGFCFALARDLFGKGTALAAVMLTAVLPFFFLFGFFTTPDAPLTACWAGALFFLERALLAGRAKAWLVAGICIGLGMLSKYTIVLLVPATAAFLLLDRPSRRWLRRPEPYLALIVAGLLFSPVILWNMRHDWASFLFQSAHRLDAPSRFGLPMLLVAMALLITPMGVFDAFRALFSSKRLFTIVFTLVPLSVFVLFSLSHEVKVNWTGPLWLAALPALARQISTPLGRRQARLDAFSQRLWPFTLVSAVLLFGGFLHYTAIGLPGVGVDEDLDVPVAWEEIGRDVEQLAEQVQADLGAEPLVVGMDKYALASELAFYRRHGRKGVELTSSRHHFGGSGLMYGFWFPPGQYAGRTLLLVSLDRTNLERQNIPRWARLGPIEERNVLKHGHSVRYCYRIAYDYRPPPAAECDWTSK